MIYVLVIGTCIEMTCIYADAGRFTDMLSCLAEGQKRVIASKGSIGYKCRMSAANEREA